MVLFEIKKRINFKKEEELLKLLDKHRGKYGEFDCVVPGGGGKDSCYASHILKYKYGMNPLTVTWPPVMYTSYGLRNFKLWLKSGNFDNITANRNPEVMRILTQLAIKNLLHPFQTFIIGQKNFPIKVALDQKIPLIFYGENEAEHGNAIADNFSSLRDKSFTLSNLNKVHLGGVSYKDLVNDYKINRKDLDLYLPPEAKKLKKVKSKFTI